MCNKHSCSWPGCPRGGFNLISAARSGWKIPGDLVTQEDGTQRLRCGTKEELFMGITAASGVSKYMIRVAAEPHVLERVIVANVAGKKFPVLLELHAHRQAAR